ncbi:MAG: hypothetical protein PHU21_14480 [Elusimicrobia bacterium]|nr:hypothetical protein [Elusimicrobiota bacterium]
MPRRLVWTLAALAAASAAILCAAPAQYLGRQQDDLLYIIGSQSLAQGSYRLSTCIGQPPLVAVVPGLPVLLLPVTWLSSGGTGAYQVFCALVLAGLPWLVWWWCRRRLGEPESVLVALLFATSPLVLCQSGAVMSEGPYTALAVLFLAAAESGRWPAAGALLLALTQLRLAGWSLLPAALCGPWRLKDRRAALWLLLPAASAAALWYAWSHGASRGAGEFHVIELRDSYQGHLWSRVLAVACDNARYYLASWGGAFWPLDWSRTAALAGAALAALALRGAWLLRGEERARPAVLLLCGAALLHLFWPWQYDRYLIPLLPWLLWLVAAGAGRRALPLLGLLLALQLTFHSARWLAGVETWRVPELSRTYAWLRAHSGSADGLASALNVRDGILCSRPSLPLPDVPQAQDFAGTLRRMRVRWVLWQDGLDIGLSARRGSTMDGKLQRIRAYLEDDRWFRRAYADPKEDARVYERL